MGDNSLKLIRSLLWFHRKEVQGNKKQSPYKTSHPPFSLTWQLHCFPPPLCPHFPELAHMCRRLSARFDGRGIYLLGVLLASFYLHWPPFTLKPQWPTEVERPERCTQNWQVSLQTGEDYVDPKNHLAGGRGRKGYDTCSEVRLRTRISQGQFLHILRPHHLREDQILRLALWCPGTPRAHGPCRMA